MSQELTQNNPREARTHNLGGWWLRFVATSARDDHPREKKRKWSGRRKNAKFSLPLPFKAPSGTTFSELGPSPFGVPHFWSPPFGARLDERVIGRNGLWTNVILDESVFGWHCHWMKLLLDESVSGEM